MKIKKEDVYRISLLVPILFFIREYFYIFTEMLNGKEPDSVYLGLSGAAVYLSIPLLPYLFTLVVLLLISRRKTAKEIFRIFVFAPVIHGVFVAAWFAIFSYLTVTGVVPTESTMAPVLVALVAIIVVIPIGYFIMGITAGIYLIAKKLGLIDDQYRYKELE
jgi:hypothetical protein